MAIEELIDRCARPGLTALVALAGEASHDLVGVSPAGHNAA
jgi:hypothetical protein